MATQEIIKSLKDGFEAQIAKADEVKADLTAKSASVDQLGVEVETEKKAEYDRGFNEGLAQAGQLNAEGKIYSDAELNAEIQPREEKIAALSAELDTVKLDKQVLEEQVAGIPAQIDAALAAFKAELKAKYEEQQVVESQSETGFAELLA